MADKIATDQSNFDDTTSELNRTEFIVRQVLNRMATATLVQVVAVDTDTVDIRPMIAQIDGAGNAIAHGTIHNVPVFTLRAGNSAVIATPVVGDIGLAIFCHNDISSAKKNKKPSNPGSRRRFDWADALYLGGFFGAAPTSFVKFEPGGGITIQSDQPVTIRASQIYANGHLTVQGDLEVTGASMFQGKTFSNHIHSGVASGAGNSGPPV